MKDFFTALFWFLVLAFFALLFHYFFGEKLCGVCHKDADNANQEQVETTPTTNVVPKLTQFMITDANGSTIFKFPSNFIVTSTNAEAKYYLLHQIKQMKVVLKIEGLQLQ